MLPNVPISDLHKMDMGVHIHVMDEWNEEVKWNWQPASVSMMGPFTMVVQEDGIGGTHVAVYATNGEGDLLSLRVYGGSQYHGAMGEEYWEGPRHKKNIDEAIATWNRMKARGKEKWQLHHAT